MTTPSGAAPVRAMRLLLVLAVGLLAAAVAPSPAAAQRVRITKLSDVAFGSLTNLGVDAVRNQSVCVFSQAATRGYHVTATGSAPGGSFALLSGGNQLAYDVQWSPSAGQSSGTQLSPNVTLTGLTSTATQQSCNSGPATSASLIVVLRSTTLSNARAGSYAGTLTLVIGPE
ncbi:hypothetical protein H9L15_15770 (plasmid) [Sphingomonas daechungensis]|uniref:Spore coat protein U domain-containing protein n=1 Tax=Sphingomonas daechungensis TaxID=1176646 RepID=A0ABX6TA78_9SPHN|nr:hypothetical protein [Sphingomonas daechungensis]QNP44553.1 hypothetical protein H9L15_15770 [Sphingomonas daechungensis]